MASVKKLGNKFYVYYYHPTLKADTGKRKQVYEDFDTEEQAQKRKTEIEYKLKRGDLSMPANMTIEDYFYTKYVPLYAQAKWKFKTWDTNMCMWKNDILPFFGSKRISKVTPSDTEAFMLKMQNTKVRNRPKTPVEDLPFLSETSLRYYFNMVHCFFKKAVEWEDIEKNPVICAKPGISNTRRGYWEPEQFEEALINLEDELLHLAIHFAFRCTLRIGELCALTWSDTNYDTRRVSIDKQMQRVTLDAMKCRQNKQIFYVYPPCKKNSQSRLILTTPKSDFGTRVNTMSEQLCEELRRRELKVAMDKIRLGKKYQDNNLIFCMDDGRPLESGRLSRRFSLWQKKNGLEAMGEFDSIDFHSIRISSTSLKLAVSGGDVKSAQKDLGDKTTHMVLSTYARSLGKQHKEMNEKFDEAFYGDGDKTATSMVGESINNELLLKMVTEQLKRPEFLETVLKAMQHQNA